MEKSWAFSYLLIFANSMIFNRSNINKRKNNKKPDLHLYLSWTWVLFLDLKVQILTPQTYNLLGFANTTNSKPNTL